MSAKKQQAELAKKVTAMCEEIFAKEHLSEEDRVDIETLCAMAIELIKHSAPSVVRKAGMNVELRFRLRDKR